MHDLNLSKYFYILWWLCVFACALHIYTSFSLTLLLCRLVSHSMLCIVCIILVMSISHWEKHITKILFQIFQFIISNIFALWINNLNHLDVKWKTEKNNGFFVRSIENNENVMFVINICNQIGMSLFSYVFNFCCCFYFQFQPIGLNVVDVFLLITYVIYFFFVYK